MTDSLPTTSVTVDTPSVGAPPAQKYLVGVLYYGPVDREHDRCVKALYDHPYIHSVFELQGCPYIDVGRGMIATKVLDDPAIGGLLFIDHDMLFDPCEIEKVIESAEASRGVVGAAYSMRRPGKIIGGLDTTKIDAGKKIVFFAGGELLPAQHLGMGMTAIHRSVFERLVAASAERHTRQQANLAELQGLLAATFEDAGDFTPLRGPSFDSRRPLELLEALVGELKEPDLPRLLSGISDGPVVPFFSLLQRPMPGLSSGIVGYYYGEDVSFCIRSHEIELPVGLDTRVRVFHKGTYAYGLEDVGMQVPWCDTLVALDALGADVTPQPAWFSASPEVQAALDAAGLKSPGERRATVPSAPELLQAPSSNGSGVV